MACQNPCPRFDGGDDMRNGIRLHARPHPAWKAVGEAQIARLEREYESVRFDPRVATETQMVFGSLRSILKVGTHQLMWELALSRAVRGLDSLRQGGVAPWTW